MSHASHWAASASNKFRQARATTESPTMKLMADGLTHLSEAVRDLQQDLLTITAAIADLAAQDARATVGVENSEPARCDLVDRVESIERARLADERQQLGQSG
jgi:RES domain-containing protein